MKCMAMRTGGLDGESSDIADIEALAIICAIESADAALEIVESFYPAGQIQPKVRFGVEEIMGRVLSGTAQDGCGPSKSRPSS